MTDTNTTTTAKKARGRPKGANSARIWNDQQPVVMVNCDHCGRTILRPTKEARRKPSRMWFCSREHFHAWQRAHADAWMRHCRLR